MKETPVHSLLAFSASPRLIPCPGSMAYPENTADSDGGFYANEGTAAHDIASRCLKTKTEAAQFIGEKIKVGKDTIEVTEHFADHVQTYVDDVRRRAIGGYLMVEQRVTLEGIEGFDASNYGTSDAIIAMPARRTAEGSMPAYGVVEDLKFGMGERVYAWTRAQPGDPFTMTTYFANEDGEGTEVVPNYQLMMYALAARADIEMLVGEITGIHIVINQPRIGNLSELWVPVGVIERFGVFASDAAAKAMQAVAMSVAEVEAQADMWLHPGEKQCRWCRALARCPAAAKKAQADVGEDFEVIDTVTPTLSNSPVAISKAFQAIPFIREWIKAVEAQAHKMVADGIPVMGSDGKPMKFVEGDLGDRKWNDEKAAEAALVGVLGEDAYTKKILSAAAAAKKLDKKKTARLWADGFAKLVTRAPGKPKLVLGSDSRPPYSGAATSDDFEVES